MTKLLGEYENGNFTVRIFKDGTKVRKTNNEDDTVFIPKFAENINLKITDKCTGVNCAWCHEGSSPGGKHGNIMGERFIDTLKPWQEVTIGGGNVLEHPSLVPFLRKLKFRNVIANITVNQFHFEQNQDLIKQLVDEKLIYGLEISLMNPNDEFIKLVKSYPNAVIHVINGIVQGHQINKLRGHGLNLLILGYKKLRRGSSYYEKEEPLISQRMRWMYDYLGDFINDFQTVCFDNLALKQLNVKSLLTNEEWEKFYMGDDAMFTFYIDMSQRTFAKNSVEPLDSRYDLLDDVVDMFTVIKNSEHLRQPSEHVYCTCCRHFNVTQEEGPDCNHKDICDLYDSEDSKPYKERPYYEPIKEEGY